MRLPEPLYIRVAAGCLALSVAACGPDASASGWATPVDTLANGAVAPGSDKSPKQRVRPGVSGRFATICV